MSFRDFITNRLFRMMLGKERDELSHIRAPRNPTQEHIHELVQRLLLDDKKQADAAERELELIGAKAKTALANALHQPEFLQDSPLAPESFHSRIPLQYLLALVNKIVPDALCQAAPQLVSAVSSKVRKTVASFLAAMGREDTIPSLTVLLQDSDGYVRSYVMMSVREAVEARRATRGFCERLYELTLEQCDQKWIGAINNAVETLFIINRQRAAVDLSTERWLRPCNPNVHQVLEGLNLNDVRVSVALVRSLMDHAMPLTEAEHCYPHQYTVAACLNALALQLGKDAFPFLDKVRHSTNERVQEGFGEATARVYGIRNAWEHVLGRIEFHGYEKLTHPQRVYYCAFLFDAEVCNGGITQFFGNSSGDHAVDTLEALRELEHPEAIEVLETAMKLVGPLSREPERDMRLVAFENRFDELQSTFEPLETKYYPTSSKLRRMLNEYAARNAVDFR
jgi:hypothetical protein